MSSEYLIRGVGRYALAIVQPATVVRSRREGFKRFWTRRNRAGRVGRTALGRELVGVIRKMSKSNVTWGGPRISNELANLGIDVAVSTVATPRPRAARDRLCAAVHPEWRAAASKRPREPSHACAIAR